MRRLRNVRLMRVGNWKGDDYTRQKFDEAVENFKRFQKPGESQWQRLPIVIGHGPGDLEDDSIPAYGDVSGLSRQGDSLFADEIETDDETANAIEKRLYDDLSPEMYASPPEGIPGKGMMVRRIALLGGELPHLKRLNPGGLKGRLVPMSEKGWRPKVKVKRVSQQNGRFAVFSEERPMNRDEMMTALVGAGMNHDVVEGMDDMQPGEVMKAIQGGGAPADTAGTFAEDDKAAADAKWGKMKACYKEKFGEDPPMGDVNGMTQQVQPPQQQFSEMARAQAKLFCKTYEDRIDPAELDETSPMSLVDQIMLADDSRKVHKFSESGKDFTLTDREALMRRIRQKPIRYKGQQMKSGQQGAAPVTFAEGATRKDKVKAFAEANGQKLSLIGMKPDEYVKAWEIADDDDKAQLEAGVGFTG